MMGTSSQSSSPGGQESRSGYGGNGPERHPIATMDQNGSEAKLGTFSGVYVPVFLNVMSILMFLRFGLVLGQVGFLGMIALLVVAYFIDLLTILSLSAIASNGEVKGGGAYYLISRSLGPEFGGSIGILFYLAQVLNTSMNVVGLVDCIRLNIGPKFPQGYWMGYGLETAALLMCACLCLLGSATFSKASNALVVTLGLALLSIPVSAVFKEPFHDKALGLDYTGPDLHTLADNFLPHTSSRDYHGLETFRHLFGILFPATAGIFAGASMSGDLREPSKAIPDGTLWAMLTTFIAYFVVILSLAATTTHTSFQNNPNVISSISIYEPIILAGECAVTFFSALMGLIGAAKLFQAFARDRLLPGLAVFGRGSRVGDEPILALVLTYVLAQLALFCDLNEIATLISMGYQMTFFVMNLACFLLKVGSAPNFRPSFKFFTWQSAFLAGLSSAAAMFFIEETYAAMAIALLVLLFVLIHYLSPPKYWGDVSQNLIYHQVRKYLLRLKPEHIKFWRPHIILLINDPRKQTRLIQFCNSLKKGSLYILGHVIVTDDFNTGVHEARLQQNAWTNYISEFSRIKAFVQLIMSPNINWGVRNLILSAGLGGMRPNMAVLGFYNMDELRKARPRLRVPEVPSTPTEQISQGPASAKKSKGRRRHDTSARLLAGFLPTDSIRTETMMSPMEYMTMLEDLALRYRLNVAVAYGFDKLETPDRRGANEKKYIDLWPIQMSAEVNSDGKNLLTTNFDTYTLILQLGHILHSVQAWKHAFKLRIMVFVEYDSEVDQEYARVHALLEKLRIEAEVRVFCLNSGHLNSYDLIIHGESYDIDWEILVNDTLKNEEWWDELQLLRGQAGMMNSTQEINHLAHIVDSTAGRPGVYNPHEDHTEHRRASLVEVSGLSKKPVFGTLSRMGIHMGIHTNHLQSDSLHEMAIDENSEADDSYATESEGEQAHNHSIHGDEEALGQTDSVEQPLLANIHRDHRNRGYGSMTSVGLGRSFHGGPLRSVSDAASGMRQGSASVPFSWFKGRQKQSAANPVPRSVPPEMQELVNPKEARGSEANQVEFNKLQAFPTFESLESPDAQPIPNREFLTSQSRESTGDTIKPRRGGTSGTSTPTRPNLSRQSSAVRFSSRPVPETKITTEADGSKISFAPPEPNKGASGVDRPTFSRQSSLGKFSSRPVPEMRVAARDDEPRTIAFAEEPVTIPASAPHSRHHSRQNSTFGRSEGDLPLPGTPGDCNWGTNLSDQEEAEITPSAMNAVELSFNELPSRAQHLILNELMRQHSRDTAVLLSTLPIPSEGTNLDHTATIQYLSDVEVLCNQLPPTLMVLSNNMTVTVSL